MFASVRCPMPGSDMLGFHQEREDGGMRRIMKSKIARFGEKSYTYAFCPREIESLVLKKRAVGQDVATGVDGGSSEEEGG